MSTLPASSAADAVSNETASDGSSPNGTQPETAAPQRQCTRCEAPMRELQDWCVQCGAGAPGSLGGRPGWRTGAAILGATVLLVAGASVAAYAALTKTKHKPSVVAAASSTPAPTTPPPAAASTTPATAPATAPGAVGAPGTPTTIKATPPKIPLQTPTPKSSGATPTSTTKTVPPTNTPTSTTKAVSPTKTTSKTTKPTKTTSTTETTGSETKTTTGKEPPSPILLDTNAASTYNPYGYSSSMFGEPGLAIDGNAKTAWTAGVEASSAPKMAVGLLLDLKTAQKLGSATVKTTTTEMVVSMYGTNTYPLPATIVSHDWTRLSRSRTLWKKATTIKLITHGAAYRFVLLWITEAPPSSMEASPGRVAVNELELFPPS